MAKYYIATNFIVPKSNFSYHSPINKLNKRNLIEFDSHTKKTFAYSFFSHKNCIRITHIDLEMTTMVLAEKCENRSTIWHNYLKRIFPLDR